MSGNHSSQRTSSGSTWKVALLIVLLIVVIGALCFLLWQLFGADIMGMLDGSGSSGGGANVAPGIFTQVDAEYSNGKSVARNISVTQGTERPDTIPETDDVVLLDIAWTGKKAPSEPLYITVSDPSFTDGDGLAVYHQNAASEWDLVGQYEIRNNSVTFLTAEPSSFAFQVLSSEPEPIATLEPVVATPEPTATPLPTPEPTPEPIQVVDYGNYSSVQTGAYTLAGEMEDDETYIVALVKDLPTDAVPVVAEDEQEEEDTEEDTSDSGLTISYVDAPETDAAADAAAPEAGQEAGTTTAAVTPTATVLMNLDGEKLGLVNMPLVQTDDGTWCLSGPITAGMLWTSNRDAYKDEHRFSLANNDRYLNLDDNDQNVILNDNRTRTRWLIDTATRANGTSFSTLNYRNGERYYINQMSIVTEALPSGVSTVTPTQAPDGTTPATISIRPVYVGMAAPADTSGYQERLSFTASSDQTTALQLVLFKLDETISAPAGVSTILEHNIIIPTIDDTTNLSTLVIRDGDKFLQLGVDYTINARVDNGRVIVVIQFMGDYSGQIVRTYEGTTIVTNEMPIPSATPAASPTPAPSPSPTPYLGTGEGGVTPPPPTPAGGATPPPPTQKPACETDTNPDDPPEPGDECQT